jgi:hypothetical protein
MKRVIAIVGGTGPAGSGLAQRWARAGEHVVIGSRDAKRAQEVAAEIAKKTGGKVEGAENAAAVALGDVVVLAIPFPGHATLIKKLRPAFRKDAVVIDVTVPLASDVGGHATRTLGVWQGSAAQQAAEMLPGIAVAAAFQNVAAGVLAGEAPVECDVIVCTDDPRAREVTSELAVKIPGVHAVDGGRLENARIVEQLTALLITINKRHKSHSAGVRITGIDSEKARG